MRLRAKEKKESGIFMPLSCLEGKYSIGSLGIKAYEFIDNLKLCGFKYWDIGCLSLNISSDAVSSFAGEPLFIDIDFLMRDGLLNPLELSDDVKKETNDYEYAKSKKLTLIEIAAKNLDAKNRDFNEFVKENAYWLDDFALFITASKNGQISVFDFKEEIKKRDASAIESFKLSHRKEIKTIKAIQFLFFSQLKQLRKYASLNGIRIIGKTNYYTDCNCAEFWSSPENFKTGKDLTPIFCAAICPTETLKKGKKLPYPAYDLDFQKRNNFEFLEKKLLFSKKFYDVVKIENFNSFADFYSVPFSEADALGGKWEKGIGFQFFNSKKEKLKLNIIASDFFKTQNSDELLLKTDFWKSLAIYPPFKKYSDIKEFNNCFDNNTVCYAGISKAGIAPDWENNGFLYSYNYVTAFKIFLNFAKTRAGIIIYPIWDLIKENKKNSLSSYSNFKFESRTFNEYLGNILKKLSNARK